jgi:hypothetical protein
VEILGLVFAGSATGRRPEMARFVADVLGLEPAPAGGVSADMFALPDGAFFAVAGPRDGKRGATSRTIGFLVADLEGGRGAARRGHRGRRAGRQRSPPLRPLPRPRRQLYELVEER